MKKLQANAGYTLIEVVVAIFVIGVALVPAFYLLNSDVGAANYVKNSYIASTLTQEAMEVVRNIRDNDWHAGLGFGASLPDGSYRVQWNSTSLLSLAGNPKLLKDANGIYSYDSGVSTLFTRTVDISTPASGPIVIEKKVVVTVNWLERGQSRSFSAEEHLFNWK